MLSIELLPAAHGDAIWIEYGPVASVSRILIDGGPAPTYQLGLRRRIELLPQNARMLELFVVTHIDADHIDGALILLQELSQLGLSIKELWFNGWDQLPKTERDTFAPLQGEFLGGVITLDNTLRQAWNRSFGGKAVATPETGNLTEIKMPGGAKITLLGPTAAELKRLRARWASAIRDFSPGDADEAVRRLRERREYRPPATPATFGAHDYGDDRAPANGSSIAFVFEYDEVAILFAGDAHARTLAASLARLAQQRGVSRLHFDAIKLPHHGSMGNVSDDWIRLVDSNRWLFSTNGAIFDHPDVATAELIVQHCPQSTMLFNYLSPSTQRMEEAGKRSGWASVFPQAGADGGLRLSFDGASGGKPDAARGTRHKR